MASKLWQRPTFSPEILSRILRFYVDLGKPGLDEFLHIPMPLGSPNPITFGLVCREWRVISISKTPGIWSSLHIDIPEVLGDQDAANIPSLIACFIKRSQNLPLTIRLVIYPAFGLVSYLALGSVFAIILAEAHRWNDFLVTATPHGLPLLLHSTALQPHVRRSIPWNTLQTLNFAGVMPPLPFSACEEVLRHCSSLKHCQLTIGNETRYGEIVPEAIALPSLETLFLIEKGLPSHRHPIYELFLCPNLRELTIAHEGNHQLDSQQLEFAKVSLLRFLGGQDMSQLYLLHFLEIPTSDEGLIDILAVAPEEITHLLLSHGGNNSPITSNLLFALTVELPSSTPLDDPDSEAACACSDCDGSSVDGSDLGETEGDQDSLPDHPILYTILPYLIDISVISNACSGRAIEEFLRSRWAAEWHVTQLRHARFDLLGRAVEPDIPARMSDCCSDGLILRVGDV